MDKAEELRKKLLKKAKTRFQETLSESDVHIIKAVGLLEDLDNTVNLLAEQVIEWHSIHFPEMRPIVQDNESCLKLIYHLGTRSNFSKEKILKHFQNKEKAEKLEEKARTSIGIALGEEELREIQLLALNALNLKEERGFLTKYIEKAMAKELPNFSQLCGAVLGAKILAKTGSKKRLAFMPASTVQIIGAEKALFQHLRNGGKAPKHGLLFQHPLVMSAKPWHKGKIARSVASKLSIALKADFFGSSKVAEKLEKQLQQRFKAVEETKTKRNEKRKK